MINHSIKQQTMNEHLIVLTNSTCGPEKYSYEIPIFLVSKLKRFLRSQTIIKQLYSRGHIGASNYIYRKRIKLKIGLFVRSNAFVVCVNFHYQSHLNFVHLVLLLKPIYYGYKSVK